MATKKSNTKKSRSKVIPRPKIVKSDYRTQLILQFREGINLPYNSDVTKYISEYKVGPLEILMKKFPGIIIKPLYTGIKPETLNKLIRKAKEMDPTYNEGNFFQFFEVICPVQSNSDEIFKEFSTWKNIANVKTASRYINPAVSYSDESRATDQDYLDAAPIGIGAKQVWDNASILGSDGAGIKFCDIEKGWTPLHEDIGTVTTLYGTIDNNEREHGTRVLGIVGAADNGGNCIGIAPSSNLNAIAYYDAPAPAGELTLENAILYSLTHLGFGDVLLIEAQKQFQEPLNEFDSCKIPVEVDLTVFNAIRLASALGIIVIEPGGNGDIANNIGVDFDNIRKGGALILKEGGTGYLGDSGAIIVSASHSTTALAGTTITHEKMLWAPRGERIDCYAWGENINTLSSDSGGATDQYTDTFGGTSGAAAIIAGAVLNMQSMAMASQGFRLSPLQIRSILRNSLYGTPLSMDDGTGTQVQLPIFQPNLYAYATSVLNTLPDLYMRDSLGDDGQPHSGAISWSPDVINRTSSVIVSNPGVDQQNEFGGSNLTNRNSDSLSQNATKDATNYLYFRALNQGGVLPTNTKVTAFYSEPSTLITPSLLNLIGEIDFPYPIPVGDVIDNLTVSNELQWTPTLPAGHYCFVAVISCDEDPSINPLTIPDWDWEKYCKYIQQNNNVTWKNFDIVEMKKNSSPPPEEQPDEPENAQAPDPDPIQEQDPLPETEPEPTPDPGSPPDPNPEDDLPKDGWIGLPFISPGLPNRNQKMDLEVISKLPKGVKVILQMPLLWKKLVFRGSPYILHNKKKRLGFAPLSSIGNTRLNDINFKANSKIRLKIFVHVPEKLKKRSYTIAVRQMLEGKEVGRFTWKLVPPKEKKIPPFKKLSDKKRILKK